MISNYNKLFSESKIINDQIFLNNDNIDTIKKDIIKPLEKMIEMLKKHLDIIN